jgi:hypothetical protein
MMKKAYSRMMSTIQLLALTAVFCGTAVLSSCSSESEYSSDVKIEFVSDREDVFNNIIDSMEASLDSVDFKDLQPLADFLREEVAKVNWPEVDSTKVQQLIEGLQSLFDSLFADESRKALNPLWSLSNLSEMLQLAAKAGTAFEDNGDEPLSGEHKYSHSFDVVVNDTLTYTITLSKERSTNLSLVAIGDETDRKLTVDRNGTTILTIDTYNSFDANVKGNTIDAIRLHTGSLDYKGMKFYLLRSHYNTDSSATSLVYTKDGYEVVSIRLKGKNNLTLESLLRHDAVFKGELEISIQDGALAIKCNVDNMNKFYLAGLGLAAIAAKGSSLEDCQKLADDFNAVVTSKLLIDDEEQGLVLIEPIASDSIPDTYYPEVVLQTFPIDEDNEKIFLKDLMDMFGLSFENIFNMLLGQTGD